MNDTDDHTAPRIDAVCNLITPEIINSRPSWSKKFLGNKIGTAEAVLNGLTVEQHVDMLDEAGIDRAFLIAPKMGRVGLPTSWRLDPKYVIDAVQKFPDRFSGLVGLDPTEGMRGVREFEMLVKEYGFLGAHIYPHWFELAPDHRRYYPFYAKAVELDVPVQMQVGHCLRYSDDNPLPSVGRPVTLDTIACELPEAKLVGIHVGWPWTEEMIAVAYKHPNVYIGTDAYAPKHLDPKLIHYINTFGQDKVLFGTDFPVITPQRAVKEFEALGIRPESIDKLLGVNAARLYKVDPQDA